MGELDQVPGSQPGQGTTDTLPDEAAGQAEETPDYGGYQTLDELLAEHEKTKKERQELDSLRGRQGNENAQLRQRLAYLEGQIESFSKIQQQTGQSSGPGFTFADIERQVEDGEIGTAEAFRRYDQLSKYERELELQARTTGVREEIMSELEIEKRAQQFMSRNPDYEEAWNRGDLMPYVAEGLSAEVAFYRWKVDTLASEKAALEKKMSESSAQATQQGVRQGIKIEQQKTAAGKVLGDGQGTFQHGAAKTQFTPMQPHERNQRAVEYLAALRAGRVPGR